MNEFSIEDLFTDLPRFYAGECSYWHDRESYYRAFKYEVKFDDNVYDVLLKNGFRRCGELFYQTDCGECIECISYRVKPDEVKFSRSQKRILSKGKNITFEFKTPEINDDKKKMYVQYMRYKHPGEDNTDNSLFESMKNQMYTHFGNTKEMLFYYDKKLIGYMTVDFGKISASAVYSIYDINNLKISPGKLFVLKLIEYLKNKYTYLYLGFYIKGHQKMDYKSEFGPAEILNKKSGKWDDFDAKKD